MRRKIPILFRLGQQPSRFVDDILAMRRGKLLLWQPIADRLGALASRLYALAFELLAFLGCALGGRRLGAPD
jgi:hypothetical protein